jgi:hypothetical protein
MFVLSLIFVIFSGLFEYIFLLFIYICIAVGDPIIKRKKVGITLSGPINAKRECLTPKYSSGKFQHTVNSNFIRRTLIFVIFVK